MILVEAVLVVGRWLETGVVAGRDRIGLGDGSPAGGQNGETLLRRERDREGVAARGRFVRDRQGDVASEIDRRQVHVRRVAGDALAGQVDRGERNRGAWLWPGVAGVGPGTEGGTNGSEGDSCQDGGNEAAH